MYKIIIISIILFFSSCANSQQIDDCILLSRVKNYRIDCDSWNKFYQGINGFNEELFEYHYEVLDTLKKLFIEVKHENNIDRIIAERMSAYILQGTLIKTIKLKSDIDTLWIYTQHKDSIKGKKTFIYGKYEYDKIHFKFSTWGQLLYYEKYRDSLRHIRGDNLPSLPELKYEEKPVFFEEKRIE